MADTIINAAGIFTNTTSSTSSVTISPEYYAPAFYSGTGGEVYVNSTSATTGFTTTQSLGVISGWSINSSGVYIQDEPQIVGAPYVNTISPAEQAEIEAELLQQEALRRARYRARQDAISKADQLLIENLSESQRLQYEQFGHFFVESESGKRYRIRKGRSINIDVMENETVLKRICAHPQIDCPDQDTMLIQKIMLEHQEQDFLNIAHDWAA